MIIGITGKKLSGKSTAADIITKINPKFVQYSFAGPLKDMCQTLFDLTDSQLHGDLKEVVDPRWNVSPRQILQVVGTDLFRDQLQRSLPQMNMYGENSLWVGLFKKWIGQYENSANSHIIISDVRFENEAECIRKLGGQIWRVVGGKSEDAVGGQLYTEHASEKHDFEADHTFENFGTLDDFELAIRAKLETVPEQNWRLLNNIREFLQYNTHCIISCKIERKGGHGLLTFGSKTSDSMPFFFDLQLQQHSHLLIDDICRTIKEINNEIIIIIRI